MNYYTSKDPYHIKSNQKKTEKPHGWKIPVCGGIASSPFISKGIAYFGASDKHVYAINAKTGEILWKIGTGNAVISSPYVTDNLVLIGSQDGYFYAIDAKTGKIEWKFLTGDAILSSPTLYDNKVYFNSYDQHLYCLSIDGELLWKFRTGNSMKSSPLFFNGTVFFGSYDNHFYCLDENGKLKWKFLTGDWVDMCPVVFAAGKMFSRVSTGFSPEDSTVFFGSYDRNFYALNADNGKMKWMFRTGGMLSLFCPEINENIVYFGSWDGHLYALTIDGRFLWKLKTGDRVDSIATVHENALYFGSYDKHLYSLSLSGDEMWKFLTGDIIVTKPVIFNNTIYFGSWDTYFYAISLKKKGILWKFRTGMSYKPVDGLIKDVTESKDTKIFTTWKPEIKVSNYGKNFLGNEFLSGIGYDAKTSYEMETKYKDSSPYSIRKKKWQK